MELNSLMSMSEAGVVVGVLLEGAEYIPPIHRRWPALEKIGFLVLVLALVADWHFQSAINEHQTEDLISANNRLIALAPRYWRVLTDRDKRVTALKPFAKQKVAILECSFVPLTDAEIPALSMTLASLLDESDWRNAWGESISLPDRTNTTATSRLFNKIDFMSLDKGRCTQGLFVEVAPTAPSQTRNAATELAKAILAVDLGRLNWPWPSFLPPANDIIIVSVGTKGP
jgi:hypothetical protein